MSESKFCDPEIVTLIQRANKFNHKELATAFIMFLGRLSFIDDPTTRRRRWVAGLVEKSLDDVEEGQ